MITIIILIIFPVINVISTKQQKWDRMKIYLIQNVSQYISHYAKKFLTRHDLLFCVSFSNTPIPMTVS